MNISYNYTELITELESDALEFNIPSSEDIYIVRSENSLEHDGYILADEKHPCGYFPIIDYYFEHDEILDRDKNYLEKMKLLDVLNEMKFWDKIL